MTKGPKGQKCPGDVIGKAQRSCASLSSAWRAIGCRIRRNTMDVMGT